ncbi:MAG: VanZ family protein [Gemmatimonadota bacterium]|nr:VanZ family protein [Gemmatimonadota bacterium]
MLCGDQSVLDAVLNVILFIPLGVGLRLAGLSRRRAYAIGLVTTITVELLQLYIPGRDTSLGDVVTNSSGALLGIVCADVWRALLLSSHRAASRLAAGWTLLWVLVLTASAELAQISLPRLTTWGVWSPELLHHDYFPAKVISATAGGLPTPSGIDGASADVRRRLSSDSVVVQATVVGGAMTTQVSSIANLYDYAQQEVFLLGQRKGNLIFSLRMRAADMKLATPTIRLDSVFPRHRDAKLDTMVVAGGLIHHVLWVSVVHNGVRRERTLPVDAGLGWSYLLPFDYEYGSEAPWLSALWLAGLAAPAMYWATRARRTILLAVAMALAAALLLVPRFTGVHPTPWWEWVALAAGAIIGMAAGAVSIRVSRPL